MLFLFSLLLLFTSVLGQLPVHGSTSGHDKRIIGGQFIPVQHVPHQAVIRQVFGVQSYQCGAILIAPQWLLTAEHCLIYSDLNKAPINVYLGVSRLEQIKNYPKQALDNADRKQKQEGVVKSQVVRYFRGPRVQIGNRTEKTDIMLLKLDRQVEFSASIAPIELPEVGASWANRTGVVSGFGLTHNDDKHLANTLQYTKTPILSKRDCLSMFRKKFPDNYQNIRSRVAPEAVLCAGHGGHGSCLGDSGGPLVVCATPLTTSGQLLCKDNRWQLAGVVSHHLSSGDDRCALPNNPTLYSSVSSFAEWIRRTMNNN